MAKPEDIPSDLTLELGGDLSPERFMAAQRAFFGSIEEVSRAVAPEGKAPPGWIVRTREGSHLIGVDPRPGADMSVVQAIYARVKQGVEQLAAGKIAAARLPDAAIRHLKALSDLAGRKGQHIAVRIWIEKRPTIIGRDIANAILEGWGADYKDFGTIEGRLEAIQDRDALKISVHDPILHQTVSCFIPEDKLAEAFAHFRKRVEVSGLIHYRRNGTPVSIEVESIEVLPEDTDLPSLDDVRGILRPTA